MSHAGSANSFGGKVLLAQALGTNRGAHHAQVRIGFDHRRTLGVKLAQHFGEPRDLLVEQTQPFSASRSRMASRSRAPGADNASASAALHSASLASHNNVALVPSSAGATASMTPRSSSATIRYSPLDRMAGEHPGSVGGEIVTDFHSIEQHQPKRDLTLDPRFCLL